MIIFILALFTFNAYSIDPTPGTGTYSPHGTCTSCSTSTNETFITDYIGHTNTKKFSNYKTEDCVEYKNNKYNYYGCKDNSISYNQPASEGIIEQEGMCGQVAMSNMYHMYCNWNISVSSVDSSYANDYTPGTRPTTITNGLNRLFSPNSDCPTGYFSNYNAINETDYISTITAAIYQNVGVNQLERLNTSGDTAKKSPIAILFSLPGSKKVLHWVTVVDVEFHEGGKCNMIVNSFGNQYTVPCNVMASWSRQVNNDFPLLSKYTIIQFNK